jgi:integrase
MRRINKLSALAVARAERPGYYGDGDGLWLQVAAGGTKSWIFRFTRNGRRKEMGLGPLRSVDLAGARAKARDCRSLLLAGRDPLEERRAAARAQCAEAAKSTTFDQCAAAYIAAHRAAWKNQKHIGQWQATLAQYASPMIGALPVAAVDTGLVVKVLGPIWNGKTETAKRLRGRLEAILDWATVSQLREGENPARWRGHLDQLLPKPARIAPVKNFAALPWKEIPGFMRALRAREGTAARALEFAILTAARSGEVRGAAWSEIDLAAQLWTVPAGRMKAGIEHRVPLSRAAIAVLAATGRCGDLVFEGRKGGVQLSDMSLTAVLRRMGRADITVHGFRSAFRDWCAEAAGNEFSREACEHALAHRLPDKVEAAYRRGDLLDKRIRLMQAWADYCTGETANRCVAGTRN